jgi:peptidoglycan/LPS O-acetylase OafA/YrhL
MIYAGVGTPKLLMNMFYLVGFFGQTPIVGVAWTLCLEVQFYVVFIVILAIFHRVRESISPRAASWAFGLTFVPLTVFSLFWYFGEAQFSFFGTWFMFAIGATLAWTITKQIHERWIWIFLSAAVTGQLWLLDFRAMVAVTTVLLIYSAARFNKMSTWLSWGWLQKLGKISYSLYLCHVLIGLGVISIILNNGDNSRFVAVVAYIAASLMSIGAATVLHTYVEAPCVKLAKLLKPARSTSVVVKEIVARASANDPMPGNLAAV